MNPSIIRTLVLFTPDMIPGILYAYEEGTDMDLQNLAEDRDRLIKEFSEELNSGDARHIRYEIDWLLSKANDNSWSALEDAYRERISERHYSDITKSNKKYYFRCICRKLYPGSVFVPRIYCHCKDPGDMLKISKGYAELNQGYRNLLDTYVGLAKRAGKKRDTIFTHCNLTAGLLRHLQENGTGNLAEATEDAVLTFFYADSLYEEQLRSYSYKEKLVVVLKTCMSVKEYHAGCRHVLNLIPAFGYVRKNVEYLTASEAEAIRDSIDSKQFSPRDRAIIMLLLYTGMRSCDVASIRLCDIDWKSETISIVQQKTAEALVIAMLPAVGNAIFEYLRSSYSASSGYLFYKEGDCMEHISARTVRTVANKAYRLAGIRQNKGDHKGTHLFRHHAATRMLENGVQRPVISRTLGHTDPASLAPYLHTDFKHLGELALSLAAYPVPEEVWNI